MKKFLLSLFAEISMITMLVVLIQLAWVGFEIMYYGEPKPNVAYSVIGAILALSLYRHLNIKVVVQ